MLILFVACAHHARPPAYTELEARTARVMEAMDRLVISLEAANDCHEMAFALRQFSRYAMDLGELGHLRLQLTRDERELYDYEHEDDAAQLLRVHAAASRCMADRETHVAYEAAGFWH